MTAKASDEIRRDCLETLQGRENLLRALHGETVLVTGGTGFMGCWLAETIAALNDEYGFGTSAILLARNTERFRKIYPHLARRKEFSLFSADIRNVVDLPEKIGWVIHAAGTPDKRFHASSPLETMSVIADGTAALLRALEHCSQVKKALNVSSGLVYGGQAAALERIPETYQGTPALGLAWSAYAEAKRYSETYCAATLSQQRLPIVNVRPFTFLGPYQPLEGPWAMNDFIREGLTSKEIRVMGDGSTVRSFMYGSDLAFWLLRLLAEGSAGKSYNVGSPDGIALKDLAQRVAGFFSPKPRVRLNTGGGSFQSSRFVPDVSSAMTGLGLSLTIPLDTAIERTIHWHRLCGSSMLTASARG